MTSGFEEVRRPVFFDRKGHRSRFVNYLGLTLAALATLLLAVFIVSVLLNPFLPQIRLKSLSVLPQQNDTKLQIPSAPATTRHEALLKQETEKVTAEKNKRANRKEQKIFNKERLLSEHAAPTPQMYSAQRPLAIGFYVNWDDSSYTSLKQNINSLDWVVPEWLRLSENENTPLVLDIDQKALDLIQENKPGLPVLPLLQNYQNEQWNSAILSKWIDTESARRKAIKSLVEVASQYKFGGIALDLEEVPAASQKNLLLFVEELHQEFQQNHLTLAQAVPFDNPDWDYKAYADATDYQMLMAYDQHWETSEPGPVAGQDWFETVLKKRMAELSPAKTVICFGNYGYKWEEGKNGAEDISFQQAVLDARESLDKAEDIKFDPASKNLHFDFDEDDGKTYDVWFLDAVTAYNELHAAQPYHLAGFALWRLGSEDPSLWKIFGAESDSGTVEDLKQIKYGYNVDFEGTGEILQVIAQPQDGIRDIKTNANGIVASETYLQTPSSYVIQRAGDVPGKIVLTFDDGPDPKWTPQILDILKQENVKAAFFIIGENGQENPALVKRIVNEGHEIGNHSFTHPNLGEVPRQVTNLELNTTQRLIESLTGRSTKLFRAPFFGDAEPRTPDEVEPTVEAQNLGYISVGLHLDPDDWKLVNSDGTPHTPDQIVDEVVAAAEVKTPEERGSIVLLHDGGGDRSATVAALPKLIHELRNRGYEFTTVSALANISPEQAMPFVPTDQSFYAKTDSVFFYGMSIGGWLMRWIFLIGIILGLGRISLIGILALAQYARSKRREDEHFGEVYSPHVSVIVPAFNEEKVICRTIESLLSSEYDNFDIIVVDDGSTDATFQIATERFGSDPRVCVFTKENGGKAEALNFGLRKASGEVVVALDADTIFEPGTIAALAHRFADKRIGAVAGNAKVGNRINIVTKWQALEYVTSQNFDRRAFASLNCITVVPGSVGAWRKSILDEAGGFSPDTLAEDQDLTIQVRKLGHKIGYEENAIAYTEAPDTLRGLAKQRFRWSFGTLQCMWKHKDALLNPRFGTLGFVAMPNVWIFQVLFPLISPLMDLMFVWTLIGAGIGLLEHQKEYATTPTNLKEVMFFYALFLAVDFLGALTAFLMEKRERKSLLGWLLIQRFGYRQVMYGVMVKSVFTAVRGALVGWGKLERKATVEAKA